MICLECQDTGKVTLFSHVEDCQNCDAAFTYTMFVNSHELDEGDDKWPEIEQNLQQILDGKLKIVKLLVRQSEYTCVLTERFKATHNIPILAEIFPRGESITGYKKRYYNIRMEGIWIHQRQAITAIINGKSRVHYVLECVKHEVS